MTARRGHNEGTIYQRPNGKYQAQISLSVRSLGVIEDARRITSLRTLHRLLGLGALRSYALDEVL